MNMNMSLRKTIDKRSNKYNEDDSIQSYIYIYVCLNQRFVMISKDRVTLFDIYHHEGKKKT